MAQSSRSWAKNPENKREALMQAALPSLLFRRCHINCVDSDTFSAETPAEQSCIKNCQDKTYASFDLYMAIRSRKDAAARIPIDKAAYIGMEVEHSNDTSGRITSQNQKTVDVDGIKRFSQYQQRQNKDLRIEAFKNKV